MDRGNLGKFGAALTDGEVAQALAALGMLARQGQLPAALPDVGDTVQRLLRAAADGLCEVSAGAVALASSQPVDPAPQLAEAWRGFIAQHPRPRIEVQLPEGSEPGESTAWLAGMCRHPQVDAGSVYLRVDQPAWPVAWEWPLRLGVMGASRSSARRAALEKALLSVPFTDLWTVVDMTQPGAECELLLLPGDLRQALRDVLDAPHRPRADCVLVLGGTQLSGARDLTLKSALRREARTAGVAVLGAGTPMAEVLTELVRELSHDATLDVALFRASRQTPTGTRRTPPDLLFSRTLATRSSARLSAARVAYQVSPVTKQLQLGTSGLARGPAAAPQLPPAPGAPSLAAATRFDATAGDLIRELDEHVEHGGWVVESGDAREVVHLREALARTTALPPRMARMGDTPAMAGAMPPQPVDEEDHREVLAQVSEQATSQVVTLLRAETAYALLVKIALPQAGFIAPGAAFPSHLLSPSDTGHQLDVSFVPLGADAQGGREAPQQRQVFLPPQGESTPAEFVFRTAGQDDGPFRARLLVSHQNRVIQTLRLDGDLCRAASGNAYTFAVENLVQPGFQNLAYQPAFDAALVVNHAPAGQAGVTLLAGSSVSFLEPAGLGDMLENLKAALTDETSLRKAESSFTADALTDLMYGLMQHGRLLYDFVESQLGALDTGAGRIQVVEARPGAYFPVEFLYPLEVPPRKPPLCEHAAKALVGEGEVAHQDCPHRDDPEHLCPMRFWGFRKQIERQPPDAMTTPAQPATLTVPSPLNARLDLFHSVQVARSSRVQPADYDLPEGLLKVLNATFETVSTPATWKEWKEAVAGGSPAFLLLLSHSTQDENSHLPALEISKDVLPVASIEGSYVKGPQCAAPVVFLMGCSTADPKVGFLSFVERFKRKQAALVVGTLSTISAQRAARFLALALPMFKDPRNRGRSFGEVFLEVKRAALARGDGFALSLVAYGNMSWQL